MLLSLSCGESGIWAEKQLELQKEKLVLHVSTIQHTNEELNIRKTALLEDDEVIASYAKNLGFISENEKIVKISGIPVRTNTLPFIGKKYLKSEIQYIPEWICKCLGSIFFVLVYSIVLLSDLSKKNTKKFELGGEVHEGY